MLKLKTFSMLEKLKNMKKEFFEKTLSSFKKASLPKREVETMHVVAGCLV